MTLDSSRLQFKLPKNVMYICLGLIGAGVLLILAQIVMPWHPHHEAGHEAVKATAGGHEAYNPRLFLSLHLGLLIALPLSLGGVFFVAFNHTSGSAWCVTIRRVAENYFWYLPVVLILLGIVLFGGINSVFGHWVNADLSVDEIIRGKVAWLNKPFFVARNLIWIVVWAVFGYFFWKISVSQDSEGKVSQTRTLAKIAAGFLVVFGLTWSASSWDLGMSLEPHWFSTMFGVYMFAGLGLTTFASLILWTWYLKRTGYFGDALNENHWHDLGKYLWGFSNFWAYTAFSQYMLIWYAHIPEETFFFNTRVHGPWAVVSFILPVCRFILPFYLIIRRDAKRNINYLAGVAAFVILGQILDMYWLAYPTLAHGDFVMFSWQEVGPLLLVAGSFVLIVGKALERQSLVPKGDPRLEECLHWHQ
ncbi:MAG: hypothetical protein HY042_09980 [Spirochaetia bacterium]|nr:hypothetical protein [Spirochaetia bacterium]